MVLQRAQLAYAAFYCEENVWQLAGDPRLPEGPRFAVFISNPSRSCALWAQRAAERPDRPVLWDYHVVLVVHEALGAAVYDLDTTLDFPAALSAYLDGTFPHAGRVPPEHAPRFRVVPAEVLRATFASDRSHMRDGRGRYVRPPPPWPCIRTEAATMNLARFFDVEAPFVGELLDLDGLRGRFASPSAELTPR